MRLSNMWQEKPFGEIRASQTHGPVNYFYWKPKRKHAKILEEDGWQFHFDTWRCDNLDVATKSCEKMGIKVPVWGTNEYCYKIYY